MGEKGEGSGGEGGGKWEKEGGNWEWGTPCPPPHKRLPDLYFKEPYLVNIMIKKRKKTNKWKQ